MPAPASEEIISRTERDLGVTFPAEHRARLRSDNGGPIAVAGGSPEETWQMHPVSDTTSSSDMQRTSASISIQTTLVRFDEGFPDRAVVVGASSGGDLLLLLGGDGSYVRWSPKTGVSEPVSVTWLAAP